jgi:hypothetical protein
MRLGGDNPSPGQVCLRTNSRSFFAWFAYFAVENEFIYPILQRGLAELFGVKVPAINKHLKNIFESGELVAESVISILETTAASRERRLGHA